MAKMMDYRREVVDQLKAVPLVREVVWHDGPFNMDDIGQYTHTPPSILVAIESSNPTPHSTGEVNLELRMVAYVLVDDNRVARDSDEVLWDILEELAGVIQNNRFQVLDVGPARITRIDSIHNETLHQRQTSLGHIAWNQTITIGRNNVLEKDFVYYTDGPQAGEIITQTPGTLVKGRASLWGEPAETVEGLQSPDDAYLHTPNKLSGEEGHFAVSEDEHEGEP